MEIKNFTITKRDGSKDSFSLDKIMNAIVKAFESVNVPSDLGTISKIISHLDIKDDITVEDIQNQVEEALMREGFYKVAKSFMLYRQQHTEDRETLAKLQFLSDYMESANAATSSKFDANANVEHKNIATLIGELPKSNFIRLNRRLLTERIKKMYDKELADKYIDLLQLLCIHHHVPLAHRWHHRHWRQLYRAYQPEVVCRRFHQHGVHGQLYARRCLRNAGVPHVHELFHRQRVWQGLLAAPRPAGRPLVEEAHHRQGHHRLLRADCLFAEPAHRCPQLSGRVLECGLLRSLLF